MGFHDHLKVLLSYLKEFPSPTLLDRYARLTTSCRELEHSVDKLTEENAWLKEKLEREGTFVRNNGAYYFETAEGHKAPFCSRCWDRGGKLVRLRKDSDGEAICPHCSVQ